MLSSAGPTYSQFPGEWRRWGGDLCREEAVRAPAEGPPEPRAAPCTHTPCPFTAGRGALTPAGGFVFAHFVHFWTHVV